MNALISTYTAHRRVSTAPRFVLVRFFCGYNNTPGRLEYRLVPTRCLSNRPPPSQQLTGATTMLLSRLSRRWRVSSTSDDSEPKGNKIGASIGEKDSFVDSWIAMKDRLLAMKPGALESRHWNEAQKLITALRTNTKLDDAAVPKRVEYMFNVLDRLCDEAEYMLRENQHKKQPPRLEESLLMDVLRTWLNYIAPKTLGSLTMSHNLHTKQHASRPDWNETSSVVSGQVCTDSVLKRVEGYVDAGLFPPSKTCYSIILHGMNKVDDPRRAPYRAHEIYLQLLEKCNQDPFDVTYHPDRAIVYDMIEIWAQSWLPESCERVEEYFKSLQRWYDETKRQDLRPDANIFCALMEAHGRSNEPRAAFQRIQELLDEMSHVVPSSEIDTRTYTRVCYALSQCSLPAGVETARAILEDMCQALLNNTRKTPKPDQYSFTIIISAYGQIGRADEAAALFDYMERLAEQTGDQSIRPGAVAYSSLIWAFAKVGDSEQAESVLRRMLKELANSSSDKLPNVTVWEGVLVAWANSKDPDAVEKATRLVQQLLKIYQDKNMDGAITTSTLNTLLSCYASQASPVGARRAERLVSWMETQEDDQLKPDGDSYFYLVFAWCKAGAPEQGEKTLRGFCSKTHQGDYDKSALQQRHFGVVVDAWSKSQLPHAPERASGVFDLLQSFHIKPGVVTYNSLMYAWSRSKMASSAEQVKKLFDQMKKQWKAGDPFAKPDDITYNAVIWALAQSQDPGALDQAETIIREAQNAGIQPYNKMYNSLMSGWLKRERPDKPEELFQKMKARYEDGNQAFKPNANVYTTRLQAWSKAGNPEKTAQALNDWIAVGEKESFDDMPETQAFNAVLISWARSNRPEAARKADEGLKQMVEYASSGRFRCFPEVHSFSTVISAYAKSGSPGAGKRALQLLNKLKRFALEKEDPTLEPNLLTYVDVIVALIRSLDREGERKVRTLLQELQTKNDCFWHHGGDDGLIPRNLHKLRRELESSHFLDREQLLEEVDRMKAMAEEAAKHKPKLGFKKHH